MLLETVTKWDTLSNEIQYVNLVIETRQIIEFMKNLLERVGQPFFNPKAVLQINQIPLEGINTLAFKTYFKGDNEVYVKFITTEGHFTNTTNVFDKFRNWLENRSILQITILEIVLSAFCLFSFLINIIDIILKIHDKITNWRKRKNKPMVRKILRNRSLSVPDPSVSMRLRPIRKIENEKCIGCLNRNKII